LERLRPGFEGKSKENAVWGEASGGP
jgi:hypothetical protein